MVTIKSISPDSIAHDLEIMPGDTLVSINGNEINDILDYDFYCANEEISLKIIRGDECLVFDIEKDEDEDVGLQFETYLMDKQRACKNKCIFCFIDQLPKGMRESLYFKDDDSRLSFLFGNYITLTNIDENEIDRIIKMHISPINISVHTTNPELRCMMMNNRFAGEKLRYIGKLAAAGIKINCQLVLCRGVNDGNELRRSIEDLIKLYPSVESIAAVPAGLTKYRKGLYEITPYDKESAGEVIDIIEEYADRHFEEYGDRLIYPADEFFQLAQREIPNEQYYGDMLQLENGVGMSALLKSEFLSAMHMCENSASSDKKTIATGKGAYKLLKSLIDLATKKWHNIKCEVVAVENEFFGEKITTTGLLTGRDIYKALKDKRDLGTVYISRCCLKNDEEIFLDDETVQGLSEKLGVGVIPVLNDGYELFNIVHGNNAE